MPVFGEDVGRCNNFVESGQRGEKGGGINRDYANTMVEIYKLEIKTVTFIFARRKLKILRELSAGVFYLCRFFFPLTVKFSFAAG